MSGAAYCHERGVAVAGVSMQPQIVAGWTAKITEFRHRTRVPIHGAPAYEQVQADSGGQLREVGERV